MVLGISTSDEALKIGYAIQEAIFRKADEMLVGKNAVPIERVNNIDVRLAIPTVPSLEAQKVAEGAVADLQAVTWFLVNTSMDKYQCRVLLTDEALVRGLQVNQLQVSIDAAAKGLAIAKDKEIFNALLAGAGLTKAASTAWSSSTADPESDIASAIDLIMTNSTITDADLKNVALFAPASLMGHLKKRVNVANMFLPLEQAIKEEFGINVYFTRNLSDVALVVVKSNETAVHFEYAGKDVPTVEQDRIPGVGTQYVITQYFKTAVIPDSEVSTTSSRICKITGVV